MGQLLLSLLKFIVFILLIPILIASVIGFWKIVEHLSIIPRYFFLSGFGIYVVIHLFIVRFQNIYEFGQKLIVDLFYFSRSLSFLAGTILPFYSTLLLIAFYIAYIFFKTPSLEKYFMALIGFTWGLHILLTCEKLRQSDSSVIKPHYLLSFSGVVILNLTLLSLFFSLIFPAVAFGDFLTKVFQISRFIYTTILNQFPVVKG